MDTVISIEESTARNILENISENEENLAKAIARSWTDEGFRSRLISNPREALSELSIRLPKDLKVRVLEETQENSLTISIPRRPDNASSMSTKELRNLAASTMLTLNSLHNLSH